MMKCALSELYKSESSISKQNYKTVLLLGFDNLDCHDQSRLFQSRLGHIKILVETV
jgi:hypothetical protein